MYYIYEIYSVAGWLALILFLSYWGAVSLLRRGKQQNSGDSVQEFTEADDKQR